MTDWKVIQGDCLEVLRTLPDCSVDAVVTDPPYGLSFMGKRWDYDVPSVEVWAECLRVLKPGGHLLAFAGTRTQHRMTVRIEDAGFEIRDMIAWVYGTGFPKSHNGPWGGTALKPALEPITVARKPLAGTVAENVQRFGTGALNIDGCRVQATDGVPLFSRCGESNRVAFSNGLGSTKSTGEFGTSRWPANLIHDGSDEVLAAFPDSNGSAARFFYCAKASNRDREDGLKGFATVSRGSLNMRNDGHAERNGNTPAPRANVHPTVKPTDLMRYLCRLVTPPGGVVLDPFTGSGSTGKSAVLEGFGFIGIEREAEYVSIAVARIAAAVPAPAEPQPELPQLSLPF